MNVVLIAFSVPVNDLLVIENEREHIRVLIQTTYPGIALLYTRGRGRKYPKYMAFFFWYFLVSGARDLIVMAIN